MTNAAHDPKALNDLITEIVMSLLDQADAEFQDRTGRKVDIGKVQKLKLHAAGKIANLAMKQVQRGGDPQERLRKMADLTNRYLPGVVEVVGEDAVRTRLAKLPPHLRDQDVVGLLEGAGALELARLLGPEKPAAPPPKAATAPAAAPTAPTGAAPSGLPPGTRVLSSAGGASQPLVTAPPRTEHEAHAPSRIALLQQQLAMLEAMQHQIGEAIPKLRRALEEEVAAASRHPKMDRSRY